MVAVVLVALRQGRARAASEARLADALDRMGMRMDDLAHDLRSALERLHADGLRARALDELGGSLDLDEVLARTAEAAAAVPGVDAVIVRSEALDGSTVLATLGVPEAEAAEHAVSFPPDGRGVRAVATTFLYGDGIDPPGALRSGLAVPFQVDGVQLGSLATYSHDPAPAASSTTVGRLEAVAEAAGPAIDAARRYREARQLADEDSLTGLGNRRSFHDTLASEVARAHRYERDLALLLVDLDDFKAVNDRIGHLAGDDVLVAAAGRIAEAVRGADTSFRIGGDEFAVLLPESRWVDAEGLYARIAAALAREPLANGTTLTASAGIAELQTDDDVMSLLQRADGALYEAKARGKGSAA